jgi:hypothetical protein
MRERAQAGRHGEEHLVGGVGDVVQVIGNQKLSARNALSGRRQARISFDARLRAT